eukprot:6175664-Alexandrium_andersonii.AAC.1
MLPKLHPTEDFHERIPLGPRLHCRNRSGIVIVRSAGFGGVRSVAAAFQTHPRAATPHMRICWTCLLYTSDAADDM